MPVHRRLATVYGEQVVRKAVSEVVQIGEVDICHRADLSHRMAPDVYLAASG
jgi:hypothetical protein